MAAAITGMLVSVGYTTDADHIFDSMDNTGVNAGPILIAQTNTAYAASVTQAPIISRAAEVTKYLESEAAGFSPITDMSDVVGQRVRDVLNLTGLDNNSSVMSWLRNHRLVATSGGPLELSYGFAEKRGDYSLVYDLASASDIFTGIVSNDARVLQANIGRGYGRDVNLTLGQILMATVPGPSSLRARESALCSSIINNTGLKIDSFGRHYTLAVQGEYTVRLSDGKDILINNAGAKTLADILAERLGVEKDKLPQEVEVVTVDSEGEESATDARLFNTLNRGWDYLTYGYDLASFLGRPDVRGAVEAKGGLENVFATPEQVRADQTGVYNPLRRGANVVNLIQEKAKLSLQGRFSAPQPVSTIPTGDTLKDVQPILTGDTLQDAQPEEAGRVSPVADVPAADAEIPVAVATAAPAKVETPVADTTGDTLLDGQQDSSDRVSPAEAAEAPAAYYEALARFSEANKAYPSYLEQAVADRRINSTEDKMLAQ